MSSTRNEAPGQSAGGLTGGAPSSAPQHTSYREVSGQIDTPAQDGPDRLLAFLDGLNWSALRLLQDALLDGDAHYWQRRAEDFEWARPRPGEWRGQATEAEQAERDQRLAETAQACRNKAEFVRRYGDPELLGAALTVITGLMNDFRGEAAA